MNETCNLLDLFIFQILVTDIYTEICPRKLQLFNAMACPEITNDCDWTALTSADKSNKDHVTALPFFSASTSLWVLIYALITLLRALIYIKQSELNKYENYYLDPSKLTVKPRPLNVRPCFCPFNAFILFL